MKPQREAMLKDFKRGIKLTPNPHITNMRFHRNKNRARTESSILKSILDYLKLKKVFAFRINNTGIFDPARKIFRKPSNLTAGVPDVICLCQGHMICLEIKSEKGKPSADQDLFAVNVKANGGFYHIVQSVQDVIDLGF